MIGLLRGTVLLEQHSTQWEENAKETIKILRNIFLNKATDMQHVGSTAVIGLKAKPIIDIVIGVRCFKDVYELIPLLKENGFIHRDIFEDDKGAESHLLFCCGDFDNDTRTHHIHVVIHNSNEWNNYIKFRNTLNENMDIRKQYEDLKIELSKEFQSDREKYTEMKADFIHSVLYNQ
ncbi:GrpB family protein [Clostridium sp. CS001]|uniref:GrpB family protein n=1 Tax=Clostridium sp. CS001 TaxID=2880648 RepID=UPI001CF4B4EE|nr:GrpB family protein [Clostridium sp. CS001]MCB2291611.1 GrpB family protein [Clostridium sp. CS001]